MKTGICFSTMLAVSIMLGGCGAVVVGGAATGAYAAHDRRTAGTILEDQQIKSHARQLLADSQHIKEQSNISITSYNLSVLLTGQATSASVSEEFARMVQNIPRVVRIYNEITIGPQSDWSDAVDDAYITSKAKVALANLDLPDFDATRVKVVTSGNSIYLMGLVTNAEAHAVTEKIRYIKGVKRVVKLFEYISPKN